MIDDDPQLRFADSFVDRIDDSLLVLRPSFFSRDPQSCIGNELLGKG